MDLSRPLIRKVSGNIVAGPNSKSDVDFKTLNSTGVLKTANVSEPIVEEKSSEMSSGEVKLPRISAMQALKIAAKLKKMKKALDGINLEDCNTLEDMEAKFRDIPYAKQLFAKTSLKEIIETAQAVGSFVEEE